MFYREATYSQNTQKAYRTHRKTFLRFCVLMDISPVPISTVHLCMYAAYLARFLLPTSITGYLNFIGIYHRELGFDNPLLDNWTLSTVLRGIKRTKGVPPSPKLPMTVDILLFIPSQLHLSDSKHASFWAICLVSFFGLFRKSHLLPISPRDFNPGTFLTHSDFTFSGSNLLIRVRWSKTIQFGQRTVTVPLIAMPSSRLCPVTAVMHAFSLTPHTPTSYQALCWRDSYYGSSRVFTCSIDINSR